MNWINNVVRPKIQRILSKREVPDNVWLKCPESGQMIHFKDLEANQFVVPGSDYHMRMTGEQRLKALFDGGEYETIATPEVSADAGRPAPRGPRTCGDQPAPVGAFRFHASAIQPSARAELTRPTSTHTIGPRAGQKWARSNA